MMNDSPSGRCNDYKHMHLRKKKRLKCRKQNMTKLKGYIENLTITFRDFNTPLSVMGRTTKQEVNMEIKDLNN